MQKSIQSPKPIEIARPSASEMKSAVQDLLPAIKARAVATERARTVAVENVEALREIGFYKLVQPAAFGGYEHDFAVLVDLIIELGRSCASTSWVCGLLSAHQWMLGLFPARAQHEDLGRQSRRHAVRLLRAGVPGRRRARRISPERPLVVRERLRQCAMGDLLRGAAGAAGGQRASRHSSWSRAPTTRSTTPGT